MADPELHIREGGDHPDSKIRGAGLKKKRFRPFGLHFGIKIRGAPPLDLPLLLSHYQHCTSVLSHVDAD